MTSRGNESGNGLLTPEEGLGSNLSRLRATVLVASLGSFCLGYNTAVVAGAVLSVKKDPDFSRLVGPGSGFVNGMLVSCALAGAAVGAVGGLLADYTGRRRAMLIAATIYLCSPVIMALAPNIWVLVVGRTLAGVAVGVSSVLVNLYISEIAPADVRGQLGGLAPFLGTSGILVSYITSTLLGLLPGGAWRFQFGLAVVPALLQLALHRFVPETPRWLLTQADRPGAIASLRQLFPQAPEVALEAEIQRLEIDLAALQADRKVSLSALCSQHRLASTLGISINVLQQVSGINVVIYFGPTILNEAGFDETGSLITTASVSVMQLVCTAVLMRQVDKIGRRPMALLGIVLMMVGLGLLVASFLCEGARVGGTGDASWTSWLAVGGMFVFRGAFSLSLGPLPYIMTSEFFPQEARAAGTALSWTSNWLSNFCVSLTFPIVAAAFAESIGKKNGMALIFCIYIGFCILAYIIVHKLLPETRGLRLEAAAAARSPELLSSPPSDAAVRSGGPRHRPEHSRTPSGEIQASGSFIGETKNGNAGGSSPQM